MNSRKNLVALSYIEGLSLLLLLFVAMPVKYLLGAPFLVRVIGSIHGGLFVLLVLMIMFTAGKERWSTGLVIFLLFTSCVPFGMFFFDRRLKRVS